MGLFQDQTNSLSEFKRLAALVINPSRRNEIAEDQWPLAMIAYGLLTGNTPSEAKNDHEIYQQFQKICPTDRRLHTLHQCMLFIKQNKGNAWQMLELFLKEDTDPSIQLQAAFNIMTLATPTSSERFPGVVAVIQHIEQTQSSVSLGSLLSLSDLRFLPYATGLIEKLSDNKLSTCLSSLDVAPNALSCEWLVQTLEKHPALKDAVSEALVKMPIKAAQVLDVIVPIPSWQFKADGIQALHSWTLSEYFKRIESRISTLIPHDQLSRIAQVWGVE